jgi:hypothetical protein
MMLNSDMMGDSSISITTVQYQTKINAPVDLVYEYYTNPNNIQEAPSWYSNCRVFKTRSFFLSKMQSKYFYLLFIIFSFDDSFMPQNHRQMLLQPEISYQKLGRQQPFFVPLLES